MVIGQEGCRDGDIGDARGDGTVYGKAARRSLSRDCLEASVR